MGKKNTAAYRYDLVSKYRAMLMGLAIVGVILCHWKLTMSDHGVRPNHLSIILNHFGAVGLELFMFVSGFGLYYSYQKHRPSYGDFMKKRVLRVLPDYLVIGGITWIITDLLIDKVGVARFLEDLTFVSMFTRGTLRYWYVITIIVYYALFPLVFAVLEKEHKHPATEYCVFLIVFWLATAALHKIMPNYGTLDLAIERFPIFTLGAICGKYALEGRKISRSALLAAVLFGFGLSGCCLMSASFKAQIKSIHYGYYFYRSVFGIAVIIMVIAVMEYLEKRSASLYKALLKGLVPLGGITLEVYLFHQSYRALFNQPYTAFGYFGGAVILPVVSSFAYSWLKTHTVKKDKTT